MTMAANFPIINCILIHTWWGAIITHDCIKGIKSYRRWKFACSGGNDIGISLHHSYRKLWYCKISRFKDLSPFQKVFKTQKNFWANTDDTLLLPPWEKAYFDPTLPFYSEMLSLETTWMQSCKVCMTTCTNAIESGMGTHSNGLIDQVQSFLIGSNVWCKTSLITNIGCILSILLLNNPLQCMVHLQQSRNELKDVPGGTSKFIVGIFD